MSRLDLYDKFVDLMKLCPEGPWVIGAGPHVGLFDSTEMAEIATALAERASQAAALEGKPTSE